MRPLDCHVTFVPRNDEVFCIGAEGRNRTGTAFATAPSRQRVYLFHHFGYSGGVCVSTGAASVGGNGIAGVCSPTPGDGTLICCTFLYWRVPI